MFLLIHSSLNLSKVGERKVPYRIVRGSLPLPQGKILSHEDLLRMFVEVVDLPKSFNNVYVVGPGTALDTGFLVYMKSQGHSLTLLTLLTYLLTYLQAGLREYKLVY